MSPLLTPRFGIPCYARKWIFFKQFEAITWFGTIHFNCSRDELARKMSSPAMLRTERHEHIHILQAQTFRTRYLGFYFFYLYYWFRNVLRLGFTLNAYFDIPFEREAYANDNLDNYPESHWRQYCK